MIVQQRRDGTPLARLAGQRFKNSLLNISWQIGPEPKHGTPEHRFEDVHAMPSSHEVSRDTEYRNSG
jgi:hypothetical protein